MGKKKGKKKGGAAGDGGTEQQPSTSSAPAPVPVVEEPQAEGGKKSGKGKKGGTAGDGGREQQPSTSSAPAPVPVVEEPQAEGGKKSGKGKKQPQSQEQSTIATGVPQPVVTLQPKHVVAPAPQPVVPSAPQPGLPGEEDTGYVKMKRKGGKGAAQVSSVAKPGLEPPSARPSSAPELPGGVEAWPSLGGPSKGRQKRAQGPSETAEAQVQPPPSAMQIPRGPPPGMGARPQPGLPKVSSTKDPPSSEARTTVALGTPAVPAARPQSAEKPPPAPETPRVVPAPQVQHPSQPRGPPAATVPVQQLTKEMTKLSLHIPPRQKSGTVGKKIRIATNMLSLNLNRLKNDVAIHYDVTFDPDKPKRLLVHAMEEFRRKYYPNRFPAFDGRKNLYSCGLLPFGHSITGEIQVKDSESMKDKAYKITVKFASEVDLQSLKSYMRSGTSLQAPQTALQAIDVVLRHAASFRFVKVGRSYFTPPSGCVIDLGDGHEMWYGFFQSAVLGWRPFINVDVAHKGFPKAMNCVDLLGELFRGPSPTVLNKYQCDDVKKYLKGLKVEYELPNQPASRRTYRVNDLDKPASELRFKLDNGKEVTVADYFDKDKRQTLRYPQLPCLWVGNKNRENKIFLPMEFCRIVRGQVVQKKMTEAQTSNMIRKAATSTDVRKQKIMDALRSVKLSENDTVKEFGLTVSDRFEEIDARILNAPALDYGPKDAVQTIQPIKGVWRPSRFREGGKLNNWAILCLNRSTRDDELRNLGREIFRMGKDVGMSVSECGSYRTLQAPFRDTRELEQYLIEQKQRKVELVVVVIPEKDVYAKVKQLAEIKIGILTQCIKGKTLGRLNGSTVSNILLKLNSKLNGVNHCLAIRSRPRCLERPIMIVGADVTHPSPDQTTIPSVAAVSASHDPTAFQYNMEYRLQPARVEIIQDLENIMRKQLMFFWKRTNYQPDRIIFYRDGVSEGQFEQVLNAELMAIRRACTSLNPNYKPRITFLVVQKRHHTRFFPLRDQDADGRNRNVPPGTVVDTDITHPTELDFYLVSHASIQGVSRPTKYHRLWDDSNMDEDELENLTYYLCHLFSRCSRSVSYPAPTYYAHLAAYRARVYLEGHQIQLGNLANEQKLRQTDENFVKNNPMYFV